MFSSTVLLLLWLSALALAADFYTILNVARSASDRDIKHAYKVLSKKYHPDKNKDPAAEGKFVEIAHGVHLRLQFLYFS